MQTAKIADPIWGEKLYQKRARETLPILVRQAIANVPITYSALALELGMLNPRNLNYVLGSIGVTLDLISEKLELDIPLIQAIVINKITGLPGEGISPFFDTGTNYPNLSRRQKRALQQATLGKIFAFDSWYLVLKECGLEPLGMDLEDIAASMRTSVSKGESTRHYELKNYIARNPNVLSLPAECAPGEIERGLLSGDLIDVHFVNQSQRLGVEVKSLFSSKSDIMRGIFQVIKYQAVMEAEQISIGEIPDVRAILILEGKMPRVLLPLCHSLGIEFPENISIG